MKHLDQEPVGWFRSRRNVVAGRTKIVALPDIFGVRNDTVLGKIYIEENIMVKLQELHPQYITNEDGKRTSIILPIVEFEELLEDIEDLASVAERREEPTVSHEELVAELKKARRLG